MSRLSVVVYGPPKGGAKAKCAACEQTKRHLTKREIPFTEAIIDGFLVKEVGALGMTQAPIVRVTNAEGEVVEQFDGYRPDRLDALAGGGLDG